jgi:NAD(P)-dependent dehydrogenase (short-subunit alcohol dehydrogenase family)
VSAQGAGVGASAASAAALLRPGLLRGVSLLTAGPAGPAAPFGEAVALAFSELGGRVCTCLPDGEDEAALDRAVADVLLELHAIDVLVVDGAGLFGQGGALGALRACLDAAWNVTRAVVNHAFLQDEREPQDGREPATRRVVYLTPTLDAGEQAQAARAGLENLARTLSVEWARHGINTIAIAPGNATSAAEVAALTAYLASPAGAYFSGCLLDLGGAAGLLG